MNVYTFSILTVISAIISFYLNINLSIIGSNSVLNEYLLKFNILTKNGGSVSDLQTHWGYIQILRENINNLFIYELGVDYKLLNYPLHHIIVSQIPVVGSNLKIYLLSFFIASLLLPILFYKCLIIKFSEVDRDKLLTLSSIIYILPSFQYSAIWGNPHITAIFFLLSSIYFILKLEKSDFKEKSFVYYSIFFLALAAYTKQFYVFLFPFILIIYLRKMNITFFIKILIFTFILAIPGLLFLLQNPVLYKGFDTLNVTNFPSSILISSSIIFIYIFPFIFQYLNNNLINYRILFNELSKSKLIISTVTLLFFILNYFFYYEGTVGGGIIYKISLIIFKNNYIFNLAAYIGLFLILYYTEKNFSKYLLSILLLVTFSTGYFVFQKYFEIMFYILFIIFYDKKKIEKSITPSIKWIVLYFSAYYMGVNIIY